MTRGMMRVGLAAVVVGGAAAGRLVPPLDELPSPARNATPEQMRVFRAAQEAGAAAAAAAREALEALLDETGLSYADLVAEFATRARAGPLLAPWMLLLTPAGKCSPR